MCVNRGDGSKKKVGDLAGKEVIILGASFVVVRPLTCFILYDKDVSGV